MMARTFVKARAPARQLTGRPVSQRGVAGACRLAALSALLVFCNCGNGGGNSAPTANAGPDQLLVYVFSVSGLPVQLNGSGSFDPDGDPLTYSWLLSLPDGSTAVLSSLTAMNPTFDADQQGPYVIQLIVSDGNNNSPLDTVTIAVWVNFPPIADAGPDQSVEIGSVVTLNGLNSIDTLPEKDLITSYTWSFVSMPVGSTATLSFASFPSPQFTADLVGEYVIELVVSDGFNNSPPDTVTITAWANSPPVAYAGPDQPANYGATVTLDGSGSWDAEGDPLTYSWTLLSKPADSAAVLSDANAAQPTFTADLVGEYVIELVVNDGNDSLPDTVIVTAGPIADAGADQTVGWAVFVQLDGSASSSDPLSTNPLTYSWSFVSAPAGSIHNAGDTLDSSVMPTFPTDVFGDYTLRLVVSVVVGGVTFVSQPDTCVVTSTGASLWPVADAGPDVDVALGATVHLSGLGSYDLDATSGKPTSHRWTLLSQPGGSGLSFTSALTERASFVPDVLGNYTFQLEVSDLNLQSSVDTLTVTARDLLGNADYFTVGQITLAVAIGDVDNADGQGLNDVVVTTGAADNIHVFTQDPVSNNLTGPVSYGAAGVSSVAVGDVNGDGRDDVVVNQGSGIGVFTQNAVGGLDPLNINSLYSSNFPSENVYQVILGDFNNDTLTDAAAIAFDSGSYGVEVYAQQVSGTLAAPVPYTVEYWGFNDMAVGDLNDDGRDDLVIMNGQPLGYDFAVLRQDGSGGLHAPDYYTVLGLDGLDLGIASNPVIAAGDLNGDGRDDVVLVYTPLSSPPEPPSPPYLGVFLQNDGRNLNVHVPYYTNAVPVTVEVGDINGDGRDDIVVLNLDLSITLHIQSAAGIFGAYSVFLSPPPPGGNASAGSPDMLAVGDINGDTKPDVVFATGSMFDGFYIWYNTTVP